MFHLKTTINGNPIETDIEPSLRLLDFLRINLGLTGTKEGCGEGECGACTVILDGKTVNSCLVMAAQVHGRKLTTIEGIKTEDGLNPVQQAFLDNGAVQCGFCIPGMVLSATALLDEKPDPTDDEIKECISGNLCRCTGYDKMFISIRSASESYKKREGK